MCEQSLDEIRQEHGMAATLKKSTHNKRVLGDFLIKKMAQCYLFIKLFIKDAQLTKKKKKASWVQHYLTVLSRNLRELLYSYLSMSFKLGIFLNERVR